MTAAQRLTTCITSQHYEAGAVNPVSQMNEPKLQEAQAGFKVGYLVFTALQCSLPPVCLSHLTFH